MILARIFTLLFVSSMFATHVYCMSTEWLKKKCRLIEAQVCAVSYDDMPEHIEGIHPGIADLPCGHSFTAKSIAGMLKSGRMFACPTCRSKTCAPQRDELNQQIGFAKALQMLNVETCSSRAQDDTVLGMVRERRRLAASCAIRAGWAVTLKECLEPVIRSDASRNGVELLAYTVRGLVLLRCALRYGARAAGFFGGTFGFNSWALYRALACSSENSRALYVFPLAAWITGVSLLGGSAIVRYQTLKHLGNRNRRMYGQDSARGFLEITVCGALGWFAAHFVHNALK